MLHTSQRIYPGRFVCEGITMIDTIRIHHRPDSFSVKDESVFTVRDKGQTSKGLFKIGSEVVTGSRAYFKEPLCQSNYRVDVNEYGMKIEFNPSKILYGSNWKTVDEQEAKKVLKMIGGSLSKKGVLTSFNESVVSRIDLERTVQLSQRINAYEGILRSFSPRRMKSSRSYFGNQFVYGNQSRKVTFYDKSEELSKKQGINLDVNLLRCELQLVRTSSVERAFKTKMTRDILKDGMIEVMKSIYRNVIQFDVFREGSDLSGQYALNLDEQKTLIDYLIENKMKNIPKEASAVLGVYRLIDGIGGLEHLDPETKKWSTHRSTHNRHRKEFQGLMKLADRFDKGHGFQQPILYNELRTKLIESVA